MTRLFQLIMRNRKRRRIETNK